MLDQRAAVELGELLGPAEAAPLARGEDEPRSRAANVRQYRA